MKYQSIGAFERHLSEAFPGHLSRAYMLIMPDEVERRRLAEKIASLLEQEGERRLIRLGSEGTLKEFFELVQTRPLLGSHWILIVEGIELLKREEAASFAALLARPSPFAYLICCGAKPCASLDFYQEAKKELILLDMSEEKPWDKKRRLKDWLVSEAAKEKKALPEEVALFLLESVGTERSILEQELFKLLTFAYEKKTLSLADAAAISSHTQTLGLWKVAEHLVWEEESLAERVELTEMGDLLALISQLRTHLEAGLKLTAGQASSVRPQQVEKYRAITRRRRSDFFARALILLFETELEAKNNALPVQMMGDLLIAKLTLLKKINAATATSKSAR